MGIFGIYFYMELGILVFYVQVSKMHAVDQVDHYAYTDLAGSGFPGSPSHPKSPHNTRRPIAIRFRLMGCSLRRLDSLRWLRDPPDPPARGVGDDPRGAPQARAGSTGAGPGAQGAGAGAAGAGAATP